jgi:hypothetical protein
METQRIAHIPRPILLRRQRICGNCECKVNKNDACSVCPKGKWDNFFCEDSFSPPPPPVFKDGELPTMGEMIKSATKSAALWASRGFQHADEETLKIRMDACSKCEFWDSQALRGTGRCMKCGCSTWAKLRMDTERCPIGKW